MNRTVSALKLHSVLRRRDTVTTSRDKCKRGSSQGRVAAFHLWCHQSLEGQPGVCLASQMDTGALLRAIFKDTDEAAWRVWQLPSSLDCVELWL